MPEGSDEAPESDSFEAADIQEETWATLLADAAKSRRVHARATTFKKAWSSASRPVLVGCDDGKDYVLKGLTPENALAGRMATNDQIVARLGQALGAPVPEAALVDLPQELIDNEPQLQHMSAGTCHATQWVEGCGERASFEHHGEAENRTRFALLALLYGWTCASDHQFIFRNEPPPLVYSVDHGHFFPGGPNWTIETLTSAPVVQADSQIVQQCVVTNEEIEWACTQLQSITPNIIAAAIASVPDEWGCSMDERVALASYLHRRMRALIEFYGKKGTGGDSPQSKLQKQQ